LTLLCWAFVFWTKSASRSGGRGGMAWVLGLLLSGNAAAWAAEAVDVAPWGLPLEDGKVGLMWEDPREIHKVVVHFRSAAPTADKLKLSYWGSRWPEQHLPKDSEPGGGSVGWMELGNWFEGAWRPADAEAKVEGNNASFTFKPVNATEFPKLTNYPAAFRYTLKIQITGAGPLPSVESMEVFTDSTWTKKTVRLVWQKPPAGRVSLE